MLIKVICNKLISVTKTSFWYRQARTENFTEWFLVLHFAAKNTASLLAWCCFNQMGVYHRIKYLSG